MMNSQVESAIETIMFTSIFYDDLPSIIQHLKVEHGLSFDLIQAAINHIDSVVNEPGTSPFDGWEKYY